MNEIKATWITTYVFAATAIGADVVSFLRGPAAIVAVAMFFGGAALMLAAVLRASARSGAAEIGATNLFFLSGTAPKPVQRQMLGSLFAQLVIGIGTAAARPYTTSALGVLAPVAGLGFCGLWSARHGTFGGTPTLES